VDEQRLELRRPHGFLLWRGKKAAIARPADQALSFYTPVQITCDGEAFGTATLGEPAKVAASEFDGETWFKQHRVYAREREAWWPGATEFLVYPVDGFEALSKPRWVKAAAPNYGPTSAPETCTTCLEYSKGFCRLHDMVVEDDHVCDDWDDFEDWRGGGSLDQGPENKAEEAGPFSIKVTGWGDPHRGAKAYTGAMVALFLPAEDAAALAVDLGEGSLPANELHVTLVFLGDSRELENREAIEQIVAEVAQEHGPITGKIGGFGLFTGGEDGDVVHLSFDAKDLPAFRQALAERLAAAGFEEPGDHGFIPHITLAYLDEGQKVPALETENRPITFDELTLAWGDERSTFPLGVQRGTSDGKVEGQKEQPPANAGGGAAAVAPRLPKEDTKGGRGSGHHGRAGRPGKRGGSLPGRGGGEEASGQSRSYPESDAPTKTLWKSGPRGMGPREIHEWRNAKRKRFEETTGVPWTDYTTGEGIHFAPYPDFKNGRRDDDPTLRSRILDAIEGAIQGKVIAKTHMLAVSRQANLALETIAAGLLAMKDELQWDVGRSGKPNFFGLRKGQKEAEAMPYEKYQSGDQWCVRKVGASEAMKCYDSEKNATAYLTALRINVEAAEKEAGLTAEKAVEIAERAAEIAKAMNVGDDVEDILRGYLVKQATEDPEADTKARGEGQGQGGGRQGDGGAISCVCPECGKEFSHDRGTPCNERTCPECDVALVGSDGTEKGEPEFQEDTGAKAGRRLKRSMKERIQDAVSTLKEVLGWAEYEDEQDPGGLDTFFKMDNDNGMAVKEVGGEPLLVTWTTNAFKDRQHEIFSTRCLEQYVQEAEAKAKRGTYDFWHVKGTDFADVVWQGVIGRFLVEAGRFHDTPIGRKARAFFTKFPEGHPQYAPEGWGSSPEYRYLPEERKSGTYNWIWIVRRSVLPRAAAANVWTQGVEVSAMALTKQQKELGTEMLGEELLNQIVKETEARSKELEEAGIAHKANDTEEAPSEDGVPEDVETSVKDAEGVDDELDEEVEDEALSEDDEEEPETKEEPAGVEIDVKAVAEQLASLFEVKLDPLNEMAERISIMATGIKALETRIKALEGQEAVKRQAETPRFVLSLGKQASKAMETQVDANDPLLDMKPVETKANEEGSGAAHFFGPK